jgi:hypothetical protein
MEILQYPTKCYNKIMSQNNLIHTNPYLKDKKTRDVVITRSVDTSCGVEGIEVDNNATTSFIITHRKDKKIYHILDDTDLTCD